MERFLKRKADVDLTEDSESASSVEDHICDDVFDIVVSKGELKGKHGFSFQIKAWNELGFEASRPAAEENAEFRGIIDPLELLKKEFPSWKRGSWAYENRHVRRGKNSRFEKSYPKD